MSSHPLEKSASTFLLVTILAETQPGKLDFSSSSVIRGGICPTNSVLVETQPSLLKTEMIF